MRRGLRSLGFGLTVALLLLLLLVALAGASLRAKRDDAGVPAAVTPRVLTIRNFLSDIYAARVGEHVIVFDAGMDPEGHALELLLKALGSDLGAVSDIFLTHGHFDHVAAAARCPNARVHIGEGDAEALAHRASDLSVVPRLFGALIGVPGVEASNRLTHAVELDVGGGESVTALPLPGHTAGSMVFVFDGVLFTGDSILMGKQGLTLARDTEADPALTCESLARISELVASHRVSKLCTGHMGCTMPHQATRWVEELTADSRARCGAASPLEPGPAPKLPTQAHTESPLPAPSVGTQ